MENNQNLLPDHGFDQILPGEVIEHIFSFCSGKDLLRLTETCKTFEKVVTTNTKLMRKLAFTIAFGKFKKFDETAVKECIKSRKFSAARLDFSPFYRAGKSKDDVACFVSIAEKLDRIKDLTITGQLFNKWFISTEQFSRLTSRLLPKVETCKILCQRAKPENLRQFEVQPIQCDFLTELQVENCDVDFLSQLLLGSKNLKRLSIDTKGFYSGQFVIENSTVWSLLTCRLEKLELPSCTLNLDETFKEFLTNQTNLQEMSLGDEDYDHYSLLNLMPNIGKVNLICYRYTNLSINSIPHDQLQKFRFLNESRTPRVQCSYEPDAPDDIVAFENDFLAFLDSETKTPGLKHSQVITALTIGTTSWISAGIVLSEAFIKQLIATLSKLKYLELYTASRKSVIRKMVDACDGRVKNHELVIAGVDGKCCYRINDSDDYSCDSEPCSSDYDSDYEVCENDF